MSDQFQPGDIFLTQGDSFVSKAIRFFSRSGGESRTEVNHVGIVVEGGPMSKTVIVEASSKVMKHSFDRYARSVTTKVAVYRPLNLTEEELAAIVTKANSYVGATYGYGKIVAHFIDWCLGGRYFARRFTSSDNYPICSWVVSYAYMAAGKDFGVEAGAASPDDIWDFVTANPDKYVEVHPLALI
jgi:hypothetical protein